MTATNSKNRLENLWDSARAASMSESEKLLYRSNLLGSDKRVTNYGGGNTSAKVIETDPLTGEAVEVLWVKGSGGDIGSIRFNDDESRLAFTVASDTSPSDIFVADLATGQATRLTHALNPAIDEANLVEATIVRYPAEGGVMIPAVL